MTEKTWKNKLSRILLAAALILLPAQMTDLHAAEPVLLQETEQSVKLC